MKGINVFLKEHALCKGEIITRERKDTDEIKIFCRQLGKNQSNFVQSINVFSLFRNQPPPPLWKRVWTFIWISLNPFTLCDKFRWNWPSSFGEDGEGWQTTGDQKSALEIIISFLRIKLSFTCIYKSWVPFTKRCIAPSLVEIGPVVQEVQDFLF